MRMGDAGAAVRLATLMIALMAAAAPAQTETTAPPERVTFPSADGRTTLVGYVYTPRNLGNARADEPGSGRVSSTRNAGNARADEPGSGRVSGERNAGNARVPAVVMMHGRAGAYSSRANGRYDAATLSQRHQMWGRLWADQGYVAILVDGFGPRGHPQGFPRFSYKSRPKELDEVTVRPLDAYGALAYLRTRPDVAPDRIALQGWSNGGSAALATMAPDAPGRAANMPGFRAALVFYPGCRLKHRFGRGFTPYAPVRVFHGSADEEVSPARCKRLVDRSRARGGDIEFTLYPGAVHGFDAPGARRQSEAANASAKADATAQAERFFAAQLRSPQ
ncbi:MAG TPA: dienelactone hydrolase family protein [Xanthobacteraceae bacterium]|nr:dienelactone hydrolase family protein [Xanthobacteraceae bacterium]